MSVFQPSLFEQSTRVKTAQEAKIPYPTETISRLGGGFLQGSLLAGGQHAADQKFCLEALNQHKKIFGEAPITFGFDRGGYSASNIKKAKKIGVKNVGIAPTGKTPWSVSGTTAHVYV